MGKLAGGWGFLLGFFGGSSVERGSASWYLNLSGI